MSSVSVSIFVSSRRAYLFSVVIFFWGLECFAGAERAWVVEILRGAAWREKVKVLWFEGLFVGGVKIEGEGGGVVGGGGAVGGVGKLEGGAVFSSDFKA